MSHRWLAALALLACGYARSGTPIAPWVSPTLLGQPLEAPLSSDFTVSLKAGGTATLHTCADLLRLDEGIAEEASGTRVNAQVFQAARVQCQALSAAPSARPARRSLLPARPEVRPFAVALARAAPVSLYLAISDDSVREVEQAQARSRTLKQFRPATVFRQTAAGTVSIEVEDTTQTVTLLARADFNGDGFEDWLVRVEGRVLQGSYATHHLWLLTRTPGRKPITVLRRWP